jgi:hypothetical protein
MLKLNNIMAKKKKLPEHFFYIPPFERWYFYVGEKYYRRIQPIPFKKDKLPEYIKKLCDKK